MSDDGVVTPQRVAAMCLGEMANAGLGPTAQPCGICGTDPDQRHRIWDSIAKQWHHDDTLDELADEYATPNPDWPYGPDAIAAVLVGQAAWLLAEMTFQREYLLAEARWEAVWVRGMLAEATRHERQPAADGLEDSQTCHLFPWEKVSGE